MGRVLSPLLIAIILASAPSAATASNAFEASVARLTAEERRAMTPSVWRPGCPVGLNDLRVIRVTHWTFERTTRTGRLVVHRDVAGPVVRIMRRLHAARVPIRWMVPVERFDGSDFRSIEADNTSAFNCRYVDGSRRWSLHAYGRAIDINPIENPYVSRGRTSHRRSIPYINRRPRPGMAVEGRAIVRAFTAEGWDWGGRWYGDRDYQHFSTGRR